MSIYRHEAAHAVAAVLLDLPLAAARCDGEGGATTLKRWRRDCRQTAANVAVVAAAGAVGNGRESDSDRVALEREVRAAGAWGCEQRRRWAELARRRARRLLSTPAAKRAVRELAAKLRYFPELDGAEATALIRLLLGWD